jgi:hypothetical protein
VIKPIHVGNASQILEIKVYNDDDKLVCISRLTLMTMDELVIGACGQMITLLDSLHGV